MCQRSCALYLCLQGELECVDAISEVGSECVVQLAQRLLQGLQRLFVILQFLQLLLETDLAVQRLNGNTDSTLELRICRSAIRFKLSHFCSSLCMCK